MIGSKSSLFLAIPCVLLLVTGCRPTDPQPVMTLSGEKLMSATCTNSIVTPTEQMCWKAVLEKCGPGAMVVHVGESTRPVYRHPGWTTQYLWTVLIRNC